MLLYRWSSLLRAYDLRLGYNRVIVLLSALGAAVALVAGIVAGLPLPDVLLRAFAGGMTAFAAAALAKELDPDHPGSAVVGAALAVPLVWWVARVDSLLPLLWLILSLRFVNRSTGLPPRLTDALGLILLAGWLSWARTPLFGVLTGVVLLLDVLLPGGRRVHGWLGAPVALAAGVYWGVNTDRYPSAAPEPWLVVCLLALTIAVIGVILTCYVILAPGDATGRPLDGSRVQAGQIVALTVGLFFASWHGRDGATLFAALWAALAGTVVLYWRDVDSRRAVFPSPS